MCHHEDGEVLLERTCVCACVCMHVHMHHEDGEVLLEHAGGGEHEDVELLKRSPEHRGVVEREE